MVAEYGASTAESGRECVFDVVYTAAHNLDYIKADNPIDSSTRKIEACAVDVAALSIGADGLVGATEGVARACLDFDKGKIFALAGNYIDFAIGTAEVARLYLVALLFQIFYRRALATKAQPALYALYCHFLVKLLR